MKGITKADRSISIEIFSAISIANFDIEEGIPFKLKLLSLFAIAELRRMARSFFDSYYAFCTSVSVSR